jgi:predicted Na+-dependent transporter
MRKKHYIIYVSILALAFIILPYTIIIIDHFFNLSEGAIFGLIFTTSILLFYGLVGAGILSEHIKD